MYAMQGEAGRNRVEPSLELAVENDGGTARNGERKKYIKVNRTVLYAAEYAVGESTRIRGRGGRFQQARSGDPANQSLIRRESRLRRESLKFLEAVLIIRYPFTLILLTADGHR